MFDYMGVLKIGFFMFDYKKIAEPI